MRVVKQRLGEMIPESKIFLGEHTVHPHKRVSLQRLFDACV